MTFTRIRVAALVATIGAIACAVAPAEARSRSPERVSERSAPMLGKGDYFIKVANFSNVPHMENGPRGRTTDLQAFEFDQLAALDRDCRDDLADVMPSELKSVGITTIRQALGIAGGGIGGTLAYGQSLTTGLLYTAPVVIGSAIGQGIQAHSNGKRLTIGSCMAVMVFAMQKFGHLQGVYIVYNAFPVNGKALRRPAGGNPPPPPPAQSSEDPDTVPLPTPLPQQ